MKKKKKDIFGISFGFKDKTRKKLRYDSFRTESWIENLLPASTDTGSVEEERNLKPFPIVNLVAFLFLFVLICQLYNLQVIHGEENLKKAEGNRIREKIIRAPRGVIYDRNNIKLVENIANFEVVVIPSYLPDDEEKRKEEYEGIAEIIGLDKNEIVKKAEEKGLNFPQPILIEKNISRDTALILESKIAKFIGFNVEANPTREYIDSVLYSHILGYIGRISEEELEIKKDKEYELIDFIGKNGIEKEYENILKGKNGREIVEVDSMGEVVKVFGKEEGQLGNNLVLSLDSDLQKKVTEFLQKGLKKAKVDKGVVVAMNPQTGEILSMVSLPSFDNNLFTKEISEAEYNNLISDPNNPLLPRAIAGEYPSGSTIKPFVAAAALQENLVNAYTTVLSTGGISIGEWEFPDWKAGGHGLTNITKAIAESVNTYFYAIGGGHEDIKGLGVRKIKEYLNLFGFGGPVGIDIPGEVNGQVPDPEWKESVKGEPWYLGDTYHMAIGQGDVLITPLQLINGISAIANGGTLFKPKIVDNITDSDGKELEKVNSEIIRKDFIDPNKLDIVRQGMRQAVTSGSAKALSSLSVDAAGKTGTAQFGPGNSKKHAWFVCFAPYENPTFAMVVLLEGGGGGDEFAVPVAKDILEYFFK